MFWHIFGNPAKVTGGEGRAKTAAGSASLARIHPYTHTWPHWLSGGGSIDFRPSVRPSIHPSGLTKFTGLSNAIDRWQADRRAGSRIARQTQRARERALCISKELSDWFVPPVPIGENPSEHHFYLSHQNLGNWQSLNFSPRSNFDGVCPQWGPSVFLANEKM